MVVASSSRPMRSVALQRAVRAVLGGVVGAIGLSALPTARATPPTIPPTPTYTPPPKGATPLPCTPGTCGKSPGAPTTWLGSGAATFTVVGSKLTVSQTSASASLNWSNFDIGAGASVAFKQPSTTAIALNRIFQSAPSQIFGALQSNGQVYLINQNGFVFGRTATVNVGGLLASSLNLDPLAAEKGILDPGLLSNGLPALASDGRAGVTQLDGTPLLGPDGMPLPVEIVLQPGAQIATNAANQRLLLASRSIENAGTISAPGGQVVLAAGEKVYLTASIDPNLRGLIVEVDGGGVATNAAAGTLSASVGNVSVVGLAVNQLGRISATTSVTENGSIYLKAQDTVQVLQDVNTFQLQPHRGGTATLGAGSVTEVLPDASAGTTVDAVAQPVSTIAVSGQGVFFEGGSTTHAPGGSVIVSAAQNPSGSTTGTTEAASIRVNPGAVIDVSGSAASVPVTRNIIEVALNSSELADDPLQRNGFLYHQNVFVDARVGTPVANVSGSVALVERGIDERTAAGGTVALNSTGDVVVANGATVNVSGGAVDYTPGYVQTTKLVTSTGSVVDIGSASPKSTYVGIFNPSLQQVSDRWGVITEVSTPGVGRYDPGYVQGANAGTVSISAPGAIVLQGTLLGASVAGINQRSGGTLPKGGQLIIGQPGATLDARAPEVEIVTTPTPVTVADGAPLPAPLPLELPLQGILNDGFSRVAIASNTLVKLDPATPLAFGPGGSFAATAPRIEIDSGLTVPGGTLTLTSFLPTSVPATPVASRGIYVGDGVTFDARGNWTNDAALPPDMVASGAIVLKGGSVALDGGGTTLAIGNDVAFEVSGGAWLGRNGKLTPGAGGSVSLAEGPGGTTSLGDGIRFEAFGIEGAAGGSLSLSAPRIQINTAAGPWEAAATVSSDPTNTAVLNINASLFSDFGFSSIALTADGRRLASDPSAVTLAVVATPGSSGLLQLRPETYPVSSALYRTPSAANFASIEDPSATPDYRATPATLALTADLPTGAPWQAQDIGGISIGPESHIDVGAGGTVRLSTVGSISIQGAISAPGGAILAGTLTPTVSNDPGFVAAQRIEAGPGALLDVSGTVVYTPNSSGLYTGTIYSGGTIDLHANRGSIVVDGGAVLDFAGTQALLDVRTPALGSAPVRETVASAGGTLMLSAPESISLLGTLEGAAGHGTSGTAAGGTLSVSLSRVDGFVSNNNPFPATPRTVILESGAPPIIQAGDSGVAIIDPKQIAASGIDALQASADQIELAGGVDVAFGREVVLQAPAILVPAAASVTAPYVSLGAGSTLLQSRTATPGAGSLLVTASESLNVAGDLAFLGAGAVTLSSGGVVSLTGNYNTGTLPAPGALSVAGDLTVSATAVEPATATSYTISALSSDPQKRYSVTFEQSGPAPATPLSAASALTVNADVITQGGTLLAPFGTIALNGTQSVTTVAGSVTSVSGRGALLPYGIVEGGNQWVYGVVESQAQPVAGVPQRQITLNAPAVTIAKGSMVDVSGGGDLYAYQWIPGPGGTKDALSPAVSPGLYAILPSTAGQFAPYDPLQYENSTLAPGQSVYLSGGSGIAAGFYPLLPARYALLPGAMLVSVAPGYTNLPSGATATAADGAPIVSGYFTFGSTALGANQTQGFLVEPGSYAHLLADYQDNVASNFFATAATRAGLPAPVLPADAGALVIQTLTLLVAGGSVDAAGASGGRGGLVELATPTSITITASGATTPPTAGVVSIGADVLDSWQPGQVLLGGLYSDPNTIEVVTGSIAVESGAALTASEIALVASGSIGIAAGGSVQSVSAGAASPVAGLKPMTLSLTGPDASGAAFLGVSDLADLQPAHPSMPSGGTNLGVITLAAGSTVASRGSLALDAPGGATIADGSMSGAGAAWSVGGARNVVFGTSAAPGTPAGSLLIDPALAAALGAGRSVRIATAGTIEFDTGVNFGGGASAPLQNLMLIASELRDAGAGNVRFAANSIVLGGLGSSALGSAPASGVLEFDAGSLTVGPGTLVVNGFATVTLSGAQSLLASGAGGLATAGNLTINAGYVTAASNSNASLAAGGILTVGPGAAAPDRSLLPLGGTVALSGQSVIDNGTILAPSGVVSITSRSSVNFGSTAVVDVGGSALAGAASGYGTQGGLITITAAGDVAQAPGSRLAVGGGPAADAGVLTIGAGGAVALSGTLDGARAGGNPGTASFYLSAGSLNDFQGLNATLEAGGFDATRSVRVASGDLILGPQSSLTARHALLEADGGSITIAGRIDASGAGARPVIELDAGTGLSVAGTAVIEANATGANTEGGSITLSTAAGLLSMDPAATITAKGGATSAAASELVLRAPALATDVAISALPANTSGVGRVVIEPWSVYALSSGAPAAAEFNQGAASVAAYLAGASGPISQRLGLGANGSISPFIEFTYAGDVTLGSLELNSPTWRFGGQPATVAIAAGGNLTVNGTISDGFTRLQDPNWSTPHLDLGTTASTTLMLTAGSEPGAASPAATAAGSAADLTLAAGAIVRSGTGDITLTAARDVVFGSGAAVYTGGLGQPLTINLPFGSDVLAPVFATFPTAGGSIYVTAGRDVIAAPVTGSVSDWQSRLQLAGTGAASWGTDAAAFNWTLGALGGGDVTVRAGRNVDDLSAAAADNALSDSSGQNLTYYGAGNLSVESGRDVISGLFYVGHGTGTVNAFGALSSDRLDPTSKTGDIGTLLLSGDASYRVTAVGNVIFEGDVAASAMYAGSATPELDFFRLTSSDSLSVMSAGGDFKLRLANASLTSVIGTPAFYQTGFVILGTLPASSAFVAASGNLSIERGNPLLLPSDRGQLVLYAGQNLMAPGKNTSIAMSDQIDSLLPTAASPYPLGLPVDAALLTAGQSARHTGDLNPVIVYAGQDIGAMGLSVPKAVDIYAGHNITDLVLFATNTNPTDTSVEIAGGGILTTFANLNSGSQIAGGGNFDLIAGRNIDLGFSRGVTTVGNLTNPFLTTTSGANITVLPGLGAPLGVDAPGAATHADFVANVIEASLDPTTGKPLYQQALINYVTALGFAPADLAAAANDFRGLTLTQQLPLLSSVLFQELVRSGREYNTLPVPAGSTSSSSGQIGGALNQSNLEKLINNIIAPSAVYQQQLVSYVEGATGKSGLSYQQALSSFEQFPAALQVAFRYVRGYTAVEELFPGTAPFDALINHVISTDPTIVAENSGAPAGSKPFPGVADIPLNPYQGDFSMTLGRLYSLDGGTISVLAPGGSVDVGLATTPPSVSQQGVLRKPSDLGIVTEKSGDVGILTEGDVLVNSSRVFTLGGGNIAIWSSAGSIDAGRGAKSAISSPPPVVTVDSSGQVSVSFGAAVAGSGIRTIITDPSLPPGNVDLVAPLGIVNAGDAGIGAAGNLNIAAASVAGLNNITAGGTSTGVPAVASGVGVTVAGAANAASSSTASSTTAVGPGAEAREQAAPLASSALSWLEVFVTGLGEENCRPDDLDCLKRQPKH
jgi:filamentous hemagglutinin